MELLDVYFAKRINGVNNKELFELNAEDIENLMQIMNSLEKKLTHKLHCPTRIK